MIEQWTSEIIGEMHQMGVTQKRLAKAMNMTPEYISMILRGRKSSPSMEPRIRKALQALREQ